MVDDNETDENFYDIPEGRWDYKLLKKFDRLPETRELDFCKWWRRVVTTLLLLMIGFIMAIAFVFVPYAWWFMDIANFGMTYQALFIMGIVPWGFLGMFLILGAVALVMYGIGMLEWKLSSTGVVSKPGLIQQKYRSWKDKHCPKARIVKE